ncbi:hypothetical protein ZWY2020_025238 [Hordeum vulgare]|nr:hypothetical protein ZWY2020_025238 [Hordeum vulgare]
MEVSVRVNQPCAHARIGTSLRFVAHLVFAFAEDEAAAGAGVRGVELLPHYDEPPAAVALAVAAECYQPEPEACSDVWFRYSPPPRKPTPKKTRRAEQGDVARREKVERRGSRALDAAGDGMLAPRPKPALGWCAWSTRTCTRSRPGVRLPPA